jgi:hypothetical protein
MMLITSDACFSGALGARKTRLSFFGFWNRAATASYGVGTIGSAERRNDVSARCPRPKIGLFVSDCSDTGASAIRDASGRGWK